MFFDEKWLNLINEPEALKAAIAETGPDGMYEFVNGFLTAMQEKRGLTTLNWRKFDQEVTVGLNICFRTEGYGFWQACINKVVIGDIEPVTDTTTKKVIAYRYQGVVTADPARIVNQVVADAAKLIETAVGRATVYPDLEDDLLKAVYLLRGLMDQFGSYSDIAIVQEAQAFLAEEVKDVD